MVGSLALFLLFIAIHLAAGEIRGQTPIAITGVTVIDMKTGSRVQNTSVIISDKRITATGRNLKIPKNSRIIDGRGKFLIPGLWDMHVHALRPDRFDHFFPLFIANGVTGIRDMGTTAEGFAILARLRSEIGSGMRAGPRIIAAGRILDGPKPVVPVNSIPFSGEAAARDAVTTLKRSGADFVKVYDGVSREEYFAIVDQARKLALPVAGHVPTNVSAAEASNAGQRTFEHLGNIIRSCSSLDGKTIDDRTAESMKVTTPGPSSIPARIAARSKIELATFDGSKCRALYSAFVKNKTWQVPTLATKRPLSLFDDGGFTSDRRMKYISVKELENWRPENYFFLKFRTPEFILEKKRIYLWELKLVRDMHRAGVGFLAGTDIPGAYTYPGFSLHDELELFVENGFTPLDALRSATLNPAIMLGLERDLGTVEKGKLADLVLLDADPLADIKNTTTISAVFTNGRHFSRDELDDLLEQVEAEANRR